jgi:hypothetical protein
LLCSGIRHEKSHICVDARIKTKSNTILKVSVPAEDVMDKFSIASF